MLWSKSLLRRLLLEVVHLYGYLNTYQVRLYWPKAVSYEEIFPRNFGVGGVTKFPWKISSGAQSEDLGPSLTIQEFFSPQSKHHLHCEQEKPARFHGSLLLRLGTHHIQNRTRDAHKISPHGTMTKRTPAMNWDHAVSWGGGLG